MEIKQRKNTNGRQSQKPLFQVSQRDKEEKKKKRVLETNSSKHEKIKTWKTKTKSEKGGQKIRDILDPTPNKAAGTVQDQEIKKKKKKLKSEVKQIRK